MDKSAFSRLKFGFFTDTNEMYFTIDGEMLTEWEEEKALDYIFEDINEKLFEERFYKEKTKGKGGRKPDPNKKIKEKYIQHYYENYVSRDVGDQTKAEASRLIHKNLKKNKPKDWQGNIYAPETIRKFLKKIK